MSIMSFSHSRDDISSASPNNITPNEKGEQDAEKASPKDLDGADAPELAEMKELRFVSLINPLGMFTQIRL